MVSRFATIGGRTVDGMMSDQPTDLNRPSFPRSDRPTPGLPATHSVAAKRRLIILGASNVTRSFGTLVATSRALWKEPLEIVAAHGHGRSYGASWSTVLVRKLPGILPCGLWDALRSAPAAPTTALVTDIGNDILYEFSVPIIAGWIEQCLDRLAELGAQTIVSSLPVENIFGLSEGRYKFFRNLFVPGCSLRLAETVERALELNEHVCSLATSRGMTIVSPRRAWYGLDPIHIRVRAYPIAWCEHLSVWQPKNKNATISRRKPVESFYLRTRLPHRVRWFGRELGAAQPSARLRDGTTVALY